MIKLDDFMDVDKWASERELVFRILADTLEGKPVMPADYEKLLGICSENGWKEPLEALERMQNTPDAIKESIQTLKKGIEEKGARKESHFSFPDVEYDPSQWDIIEGRIEVAALTNNPKIIDELGKMKGMPPSLKQDLERIGKELLMKKMQPRQEPRTGSPQNGGKRQPIV